MTTFLQILSFTLAMIASGTFLMSGFLLGAAAPGWRDAHPIVRLLLHGLAVFWLIAAIVAVRYPADVISWLNVFAVIVFALLGFAVLAYVVRHRPRRSARQDPRPRT
jgi:uncharacterized protein involved in response to NO